MTQLSGLESLMSPQRGRYEAWGHRPEGSYCLSAVDDLATAWGDAHSVMGEVYDRQQKRWLRPEEDPHAA